LALQILQLFGIFFFAALDAFFASFDKRYGDEGVLPSCLAGGASDAASVSFSLLVPALALQSDLSENVHVVALAAEPRAFFFGGMMAKEIFFNPSVTKGKL